MCVYIYAYIHLLPYAYTCVLRYISAIACELVTLLRVSKSVYMHICIYMDTNTYNHVCIHVCVYSFIIIC